MKSLKRFFVRITVYTIIAIILSLFADIDSVTISTYFICADILYSQQFKDKWEDEPK
jgi:hypothetical protein